MTTSQSDLLWLLATIGAVCIVAVVVDVASDLWDEWSEHRSISKAFYKRRRAIGRWNSRRGQL
jgi:hypothetical protein